MSKFVYINQRIIFVSYTLLYTQRAQGLVNALLPLLYTTLKVTMYYLLLTYLLVKTEFN